MSTTTLEQCLAKSRLGNPPARNITKCRIRHLRYTNSGQLWQVTDDATGALIVGKTRDPEHDAARALLAKGITGILETYMADSATASFRLDIVKAAGLTTTEGKRLKTTKWKPLRLPERRKSQAA